MNLRQTVFALNEKMTKRFNEIVDKNLMEAKSIAEEMHVKCFDSGLLDQAQSWANKLPHLRSALSSIKTANEPTDQPIVVEVVPPVVIDLPMEEETVEFDDTEPIECAEEETVELVQTTTLVVDEEETIEVEEKEPIVVEVTEEVTAAVEDSSTTPTKTRKKKLN